MNIIQVEEIVEIGELDPNHIHLPGIYVNRIVKTVPSHYIEVKSNIHYFLNYLNILILNIESSM